MTVPLECPRCDSHEVEVVTGPRCIADPQYETVEFEDHWSQCRSCGSEFYTASQARVSSRTAAGEIRKRQGLLTPVEIRDFRKGAGLTQSQLERVLGVGPKTVVRWERGTVPQGAGVDRFIRLAKAAPQAFADMARLAGVEVRAIPTHQNLDTVIGAMRMLSVPAYSTKPLRKNTKNWTSVWRNRAKTTTGKVAAGGGY